MWSITTERNIFYYKHEYINNASHSIIRKVRLLTRPNGTYEVAVKACSREHYNALKSTLLTAGFPHSDFDYESKAYKLSCNDLSVVTAFLKTIKAVEPSFIEIENDVCDALHIDLSQDIVLPKWIKRGNFQVRLSSSSTYMGHHFVEYVNAGLVISELSLSAPYDHSYCKITLKAPTPEKYEHLVRTMVTAGFPQPREFGDSYLRVYGFNFDATNRDKFNHFISTINTLCDLSEITNDIHANLDFAIQNGEQAAVQRNSNRFDRYPFLLSSSYARPPRANQLETTDVELIQVLEQLPSYDSNPKKSL